MGTLEPANTRSGWQARDNNGRRLHTMVWIPREYGYMGANGEPAEGSLCENCGKWDGDELARGELARLRRDYFQKDDCENAPN